MVEFKAEVIAAFAELGLEPDVEESVASKTYKKLALQHHPDKNSSSHASTVKFQELSKAWSICKRRYDYPSWAYDEEKTLGGDEGVRFSASDFDFDFAQFIFEEMFFGRFNSSRGYRFRRQRAAGGAGLSAFSGGYVDAQQKQADHAKRQEKRNEEYIKRMQEFEAECAREEAERERALREDKNAQNRRISLQTEAFKAARNNDPATVLKLVKEDDLDVMAPEKSAKSKQENYETLLHAAAKGCHDVGVIVFLINRGANPATLNTALLTPFHVAVRSGNVTVVSFFLDCLSKKVKEGEVETPHTKAYYQLSSSSRVALSSPDAVHPSKAAQNQEKQTPLQLAIASENPEMVSLIVKYATVHDARKCHSQPSTPDFIRDILATKKGFYLEENNPPPTPPPQPTLTKQAKKAMERAKKQAEEEDRRRAKAEEKAARVKEQEEREANNRKRKEEARIRKEQEAQRLKDDQLRAETLAREEIERKDQLLAEEAARAQKEHEERECLQRQKGAALRRQREKEAAAKLQKEKEAAARAQREAEKRARLQRERDAESKRRREEEAARLAQKEAEEQERRRERDAEQLRRNKEEEQSRVREAAEMQRVAANEVRALEAELVQFWREKLDRQQWKREREQQRREEKRRQRDTEEWELKKERTEIEKIEAGLHELEQRKDILVQKLEDLKQNHVPVPQPSPAKGSLINSSQPAQPPASPATSTTPSSVKTKGRNGTDLPDIVIRKRQEQSRRDKERNARIKEEREQERMRKLEASKGGETAAAETSSANPSTNQTRQHASSTRPPLGLQEEKEKTLDWRKPKQPRPRKERKRPSLPLEAERALVPEPQFALDPEDVQTLQPPDHLFLYEPQPTLHDDRHVSSPSSSSGRGTSVASSGFAVTMGSSPATTYSNSSYRKHSVSPL